MTGSSDKMLRIWYPFDNKPLGSLEDDFSINHIIKIGKTAQGDVTSIYVADKILRYLSLKNQKALFLYKDTYTITAITRINTTPDNSPVLSFGT